MQARGEETTGLTARAAVGVNLARGNSETIQYNVDLGAAKAFGNHQASVGAGFAYGETTSAVSEENGKLFGRDQYAVSEATFIYGNAEALYDRVGGVDYRVIVGPGVGHTFFKTDRSSLSIEGGVSYITDRTRPATGSTVTSDTIAVRLAERYEQKVGASAKVWQSLELLPAANDPEDFLASAEAGVETTLTEQLSLRLVAQDRYDNVPPEGTKSNDVTVRAALVYKLGK